MLRGYCAAKQRVQASLEGAVASKKSFGIREEHRMRWDLFRLVGQELAKKFPLHLEVQINIEPYYI